MLYFKELKYYVLFKYIEKLIKCKKRKDHCSVHTVYCKPYWTFMNFIKFKAAYKGRFIKVRINPPANFHSISIAPFVTHLRPGQYPFKDQLKTKYVFGKTKFRINSNCYCTGQLPTNGDRLQKKKKYIHLIRSKSKLQSRRSKTILWFSWTKSVKTVNV